MGTLYVDLCTCMITRSFLVRMRKVSDIHCRKKKHILGSVTLLRNPTVYMIMLKHMEKKDRPQMT